MRNVNPVLCLFIIGTLCAHHAFAQGTPPGGPVNVIAIDPLNQSTLYVGTSAGFYKRINAAQSWTSLDLIGLSVRFMAIDPAHPGVLYAGTSGVQKSTNGGASWARLGNDLNGPNSQFITTLGMNQVNPTNL